MTPSTLRHTLERAREHIGETTFCRGSVDLCNCNEHILLRELDDAQDTLPPEGAAEDPTPRPASSSEIGEVVAELCTAAATLQNDDHSKPETIERRRHVQRVEAINHARDLLLILAAIAQRQSPEPVGFGIRATTDDGTVVILLHHVGKFEHDVKYNVISKAREEGYKGTVTARLNELGWTIVPLYTAQERKA